MGCDGSGQTNLTNNPSNDKEPSWTSGGKLVFSSNRNSGGGYDLYLLTLSPWSLERLTTNAADDVSPALSPDGSKVAYVSYRDLDGDAEVYVLTVFDKSLVRITDNAHKDFDPAWSYDGARLFFSSDRDGDFDIYVTDTDLANPTNLTDSTADDTNDYSDRWPDSSDSFDGEVIAFASDRDGDWEIFTMYADGSEQIQSTENTGGVMDSHPSWDPLGEYLALQSDRDGNFEAATMYSFGGEYANITQNGYSDSGDSSETSPDWEPVDDGAYCGE